ncbi:MAG: hypothetical protein J6O73_08375 [Lachnospiraceae bacterium]|nr:hypothetical protein [Lachnospiraceae bacterium]
MKKRTARFLSLVMTGLLTFSQFNTLTVFAEDGDEVCEEVSEEGFEVNPEDSDTADDASNILNDTADEEDQEEDYEIVEVDETEIETEIIKEGTENERLRGEGKAVRTIIYYNDGASSEAINGACTDMLMEAMAARFDSSKIRFIVMTGGALKWQLDSKYLRDRNGENTIDGISTEYNQVWELFGATDDSEGYLKLIDGDGVTGDGVASKDELMNNPNTLKAFINFAREYAPAEKYDLIMLDHGSGPGHGYGMDDHDTENPGKKLHVYEIRQAISQCDVIQHEGKFDILFLECCMNGNFETLLALQDYTDYFIGSPDVDPINSLEYTDILNYLNEDPAVDAKILGKKMVDVFHDYFEQHMDERSIGRTVQLTLVDTAKFKESAILDQMQEIAETLRSEASAQNFYDEIRSSQDDFRTYYSYLQDMGTLVEQLGINIKESDFQDPELKNSYTEAAIRVQNILRNPDILYSRYTSDGKAEDVIFGRDEQGNITVRTEKTASGGLNIFFPNIVQDGLVSEEIVCYIDAMEKLANSLPSDSEVRTFITTYRQAVIDYALIYEIGTAVSNIVGSEGYDGNVDLGKVEAYYRSVGQNQWDWVSHTIAKSDRDSSWLNGIIEIQKNEVLNPNNVSVQKTDKDYLINITDTPRKLIGVPELRITAKLSDQSVEFAFLYKDPMIAYEGKMAADAMQDVSSFEEAMNGKKSAYRVPLYDGQWYAVKDSDEKIHPASIASDQSVYALFDFNDGRSKGGELYFDTQGKAKYIYIDGETKPIDLAVYTDPVSVTLRNHIGSAGMISEAFEIRGTDSVLLKAPYEDLNIESVDMELYICDIYGVGHKIPISSKEETIEEIAENTFDVKEAAEGVAVIDTAHKLVLGVNEKGQFTGAEITDADGNTDKDVDSYIVNIVTARDNDGKPSEFYTLVFTDGVWDTGYDSAEKGAYVYDGVEYYVAGGVVNQNANGLIYTGNDGWRFLAAGHIVTDHEGLVMYNEEWFWIDAKGRCDDSYAAIVKWNGSDFLVHGGRLRTDYTGFTYDPQNTDAWYHITAGQVWGDGEITDLSIEGGEITRNVVAGVVQ